MKRIAVCLLVPCLTGVLLADVKDAENKLTSLLEVMEKTIKRLEQIKDREAAEKAHADLGRLFDAVDRIGEQFKKVPERDKLKLDEAHRQKYDATIKKYRAEVERLKKVDGVGDALKDIGPFRPLRREREVLARTRIAKIEQAAKAYYLVNMKHPESVGDLAKGDKPYLEAIALKDPWGNDFKYDVKGPKNKGKKPDVWTTDPMGKTIGNWEEN